MVASLVPQHKTFRVIRELYMAIRGPPAFLIILDLISMIQVLPGVSARKFGDGEFLIHVMAIPLVYFIWRITKEILSWIFILKYNMICMIVVIVLDVLDIVFGVVVVSTRPYIIWTTISTITLNFIDLSLITYLYLSIRNHQKANSAIHINT